VSLAQPPAAALQSRSPKGAEAVALEADRALRRRRWLAAVLALAVAVAPPVFRWTLGESSARLVLLADARHIADEVSNVASQYPEAWRYQQSRLSLLAAESIETEKGAGVRIVDRQGEVLAETGNWSESTGALDGWTRIEVGSPVFDSGTEVGRVLLQLPTTDLQVAVAAWAAGALVLATLVYLLSAYYAAGTVGRSMRRLQALHHAAEQASEARSLFLATMSHEIRTPMNGVIGMASLLHDSPLSDVQREQVDVILASGTTLLRVIDDILEFTRVESGKTTLSPTTVDPRRLATDVVSLLKPLAQPKRLALLVDLAAELPARVQVDGDRVRQVLMNLVGNAIKFSHHGTVTLRLTQPQPNRLAFSVIDQGIGLSSESLQRLFEPFEQADASTSRRYGGTGLGLAISKRLVELMGGRIEVRSQPGEGSRFDFSIDAPLASPVPATEPPIGATPPAALGGLRVLVVEDNPVNRLVAEAMLRRLGVAADFAENGVQAMDHLNEAAYDVLLLDLAMPEMDGFEVARRVTALERRLLPTLVPMTANVLDSDLQRCRDLGMHHPALTKPFDLATLQGCLATVARQRAGRVAEPGPSQTLPPSPPEAALKHQADLRLLAPR
jgi:signal transduction histidine kinase/DNA-binding NarL/FixJ family response regulator